MTTVDRYEQLHNKKIKTRFCLEFSKICLLFVKFLLKTNRFISSYNKHNIFLNTQIYKQRTETFTLKITVAQASIYAFSFPYFARHGKQQQQNWFTFEGTRLLKSKILKEAKYLVIKP